MSINTVTSAQLSWDLGRAWQNFADHPKHSNFRLQGGTVVKVLGNISRKLKGVISVSMMFDGCFKVILRMLH